MDNTKTINILSLCTGYGGLELGLVRALDAVFRVVAVEVEAYALANLAAKTQEGKLAIEAMWPDLKTFPAERFRGCFDFILAGYPCQPFSVAGKRQGTSDPRHLWPHIARIVQAVRPVWCFFENVPGHLTIGFPEVYRSLRTLGYSVEAGLFTAAEVGAPHKRERLFILAKSGRAGAGGICGTIDGKYRPQDVRQEDGQTRTARTQPASQPIARIQESANGSDSQGRQNEARDFTRILGQNGQTRESQLAHTTKQRMEGDRPARNTIINQNGRETLSCSRSERTNWPSRPGQPQYEWEEPRVVADTKQQRPIQPESTTRHRQGLSEDGNIGRQNNDTAEKQAQSRLGRAVARNTSRVDRLRLCGNGVVPQQAEKALRHLIEKFDGC